MNKRAVALICCCVLALSACAQTRSTGHSTASKAPSVVLDEFIAFSDPATCQETEAFGRFLSDLIIFYDEFEARKGKITAPQSVTHAFGKILFDKGPEGFVAMVPAKGNWKGFNLTAISTFAPEGGDPADFTIHLAAPLAVVADRLKRDGFDVISGGTKTVDSEDSVYTRYTTLVEDPKRASITLFNCGVS